MALYPGDSASLVRDLAPLHEQHVRLQSRGALAVNRVVHLQTYILEPLKPAEITMGDPAPEPNSCHRSELQIPAMPPHHGLALCLLPEW